MKNDVPAEQDQENFAGWEAGGVSVLEEMPQDKYQDVKVRAERFAFQYNACVTAPYVRRALCYVQKKFS